jgi:hypothetical protein
MRMVCSTETKKVKAILQKNRNVADKQTREHYDYVQKKIDMHLNAR